MFALLFLQFLQGKMCSLSPASNTIHASSLSKGHNSDLDEPFLNQGPCVTQDQDQMLDSEFGLTEMTEAEYSHFNHFIQAHIEVQAEACKDVTDSIEISSNASTQAIDLSLSSEDHCLVMQGEKTPVTYGEVPGFVLARIRDEESPTVQPTKGSTTSQKKAKSAARVCLEKRFNSTCADTARQQDIHSAVLSK